MTETAATTLKRMRQDAEAIYLAGLEAVSAGAAVHRFLQRDGTQLHIGGVGFDLKSIDQVYVIGAGKASAAMAAAVEAILVDRITQGSITVKYDHTAELKRIRLVQAGHPLPDENGVIGARQMMAIAERAAARDLVICLMSGGGSALMPLPADVLTLADKQHTIETLLACGASIHEINTIRKHTSAIKAGRLAQAVHPARLVTLILSDVVGDDLDVIASGPTVPDPSTFADVLDIVSRYGIADDLPAAVMTHFKAGRDGRLPETPKADAGFFATVTNVVIGSNILALSAARDRAQALGYHPLILSSLIEGETREVAAFHAAIAREIIKSDLPIAKPACIISGGETTVRLSKNSGTGGRNQEFALSAAHHLDGCEQAVVLSAGTDGNDGPTDAAGAFADHTTLKRARRQGLDATASLAANDAYPFFKALGDLLITGPTLTNVMDVRILLVR